jgi:hypothetical protein
MIVRLLIAIILGVVTFFVANFFLPAGLCALIGFAVGLLYFFGTDSRTI